MRVPSFVSRLASGWRDDPWPRARAVGAGVAMALALPGPGWWPLAFLVPGLLRRSLAGSSGWAAFRRGWLAGFVQWAIAVAWVYIVLHRYGRLPAPFSVVAVALMAGILGWGWALACAGAAAAPERWQAWLLPLTLTAFEQVQHLPPWIFPWNPMAAVLTAWPPLLAPAPVIGAAGLSGVAYLAGSAADLLLERERRRQGLVLAGVVAAVVGLAVAAAPGAVPAGAAQKVAAIQPNVSLEVRWEPANEDRIESAVWRLTEDAARRGARLVVWPESAVPRVVDRDAEYRREIERFTGFRNTWLMFESIGLGAEPEQYFNSVYVASPVGLVPWRYSKIHLVPFGEYVPLVGTVPFLRPLVREVGSFTPGTSTAPMPSPVGPVGVAVCYEVAFAQLAADEVRDGAQLLVSVTNDGWYGDSAAPRQHLALAILRAAETRRFMVRAAVTGISAIIDPRGRITSRLEFGSQGMIVGEVAPLAVVTPAVRWGDAIRAGMVVAALGAILAGAWWRRRSTAAR